MAFAIKNGIKSQLPGIGSTMDVATGTARPTVDATVAVVATNTLTNAMNRGKVHVAITAVDSAVKIASVSVYLTDNSGTPVLVSIGGYNPAAADQTAGQGVNLVFEFCTDLNIVIATARITPSGTRGGSIEYQADIEMVGNSSAA